MLTKSSNEVVTSLEGMLKNLTPLSTTCCIYRVPQKLQKENREAYMPRVVSIGSLHHGEGHLVAMEEHKLRYLQNFLSKSGKTLADCVEIISREEKRARDCYMESINMSSKEFLKMILLDGCFIVEAILDFSNRHTIKPDDRIYNKTWLFFDVCRDMTLLENQLPFFRLVTLYSLLPPPPGHQNDYYSFLLFSVEFFKDYWKCQKPKPSSPSPVKPFDFKLVIPTATQLREGGMYGSSKAMEDTTFLSILSGDGSGRERVLFFIQKM
ncbi:UPF0481 protein [Vitis vinifera]|uniref:UPF0481 protein n=1 Tax=Vitis vinifera TaxID=29760 RepID=A0A438KEA6_VITVI|nr:UPF0481 protein [Vitis vinifera]